MANFHLRDIPERTYKRLKRRADANGRSLNSELLEILERESGRPTPEQLDAWLVRLRDQWQLPPGAPAPEALIREDRDTDHGRL